MAWIDAHDLAAATTQSSRRGCRTTTAPRLPTAGSIPWLALGHLRLFFGACRYFVLEQKAGHDDPYLVQQVHRHRHGALRDGIRRRHEGGKDEYPKQHEAAILLQCRKLNKSRPNQ